MRCKRRPEFDRHAKDVDSIDSGPAMRVLCICPQFAPVNAPDSHRLRLLVPYFARQGWQAEVLTVDPSDLTTPQDPWLAERIPKDVAVHRVRAFAPKGWGLNGLAQRSFAALYAKGSALLHERRFDLVFFTTTEFLLHALGPLWKRRFGIPFCMDYQDPWVNDYYSRNPHIVPPGGRLKFTLMDRLGRLVERAVVRRCSGFMSVTGAYLQALDERYGPAVTGQPRYVAGFPAESDEQASPPRLPQSKGAHSVKVWRYIGRAGDVMAFSANVFFGAWRTAIDLGLLDANAIRFEAIGTSYEPSGAGTKSIEPIARAHGLQSQVVEQTDRVPYSAMLRLLESSDALIVFGSNDPAYNASKIQGYLLARKPVLAIFHQKSDVVPLIERAGGAVCVSFDEAGNIDEVQQEVMDRWFRQGTSPAAVHLDSREIESFTAAYQARCVATWFSETVLFANKGTAQ